MTQRRFISISSALVLAVSMPLVGGIAYASEVNVPAASTEASSDSVVTIERSGRAVSFSSLAEAIAAAQEGETVKLLKPIDMSSSSSAPINIDKKLTVDLNGQGTSQISPAIKGGSSAIFQVAADKALTIINTGTEIAYIRGNNTLITGAGRDNSALNLGKNIYLSVNGYRSPSSNVLVLNYKDSVYRDLEQNMTRTYELKSIQVTNPALTYTAKPKAPSDRYDTEAIEGLVDQAYDNIYRTDNFIVTYKAAEGEDAKLTRNETYRNLNYIKVVKTPDNSSDPTDETKLYKGTYTLRAFFSADESQYKDLIYTVDGTAKEPPAAPAPSPAPAPGTESGEGSANDHSDSPKATDKQVYSGVLQWPLKASFLKYMQTNSKRANPSAPDHKDGFIKYTNTAGPIPANAPAYTETSQSWGEGKGSCTGNTCTIKFPGSIHYAAHYINGKWNLDLRLDNLELVTTSDSTGAIYADMYSAKLDGGTPFNQKHVKIADLRLTSAPVFTEDTVTIKATATLTKDSASAFAGYYHAGQELDPINYVGNLKEGANKPTPVSPTQPDNSQPGGSDNSGATPGGSGSNSGKPDTKPVITFTDTASYPFVKEINWLASSGVTTGYPDRTFRPHDSVSRAAMAAFLYRLEGKPAYEAPKQSPFRDIKPGDDFYKEICWLASKGITTGYADGTFKPWDPIARDAMAAFLHRYDQKVAAKKLPVKLAVKKFTDTAATPFAKDIAWLSSTGVTTGYQDGSFRPFENIERGAIAAFFYRMKH